ncbi:MAG: xanthine dehydrogenase family protein subunit M [Thermodesulfobacteriota bacterium]
MRQVLLPRTLDELWDSLEADPNTAVYAGGTDLLVNLRAGRINPNKLVCLERIDQIRGVRDAGAEVFIGAATTHTNLLEDPLVRSELSVLAKAIRVLASPAIRNMGTIGGNIVNASPAGDTLPPLYALDAEVEIVSRKEAKRMLVADFIVGPGQVQLRADEIVKGVWIRKAPEFNVHHFEKVGLRKSQACAVASLAALLRVSKDGRIESARLAWGSVGLTAVRSAEVEEALVGRELEIENLSQVASLVERIVSPINDVRASAQYRRIVAGRLLLRLAESRDRT